MENLDTLKVTSPLEVIANRVNTFLSEIIKEEGEALRKIEIWRN